MVAVVGQLTRETVDVILADRAERDHDAADVLFGHDRAQVVDRAEHPDAATVTELVVTDEAGDVVPQRWVALVGVHEADRVRIGADDENPPTEAALGAQPVELPACHLTLGQQHRRHRDGDEEHPQSGEVLELDAEGDQHDDADADSDGAQHVLGLLRPGERSPGRGTAG